VSRQTLTRLVLAAAALFCLVLAGGFAVVAVDVVRWREALSIGDVRYRVTPEEPDLWTPSTIAPASFSRAVLGVRDDVDLRRALRALRVAHLEDPTVSDPEVVLARSEAQARLEAIASGEDERARRSRAAGLLGVLGLARLASETQDPTALLESIVFNLKLAIALDQGNDEAKFNLELALQRARGVQITESGGGANPTPGGAGAKGAGAGDPGTGY
jgi:hypothetical protein